MREQCESSIETLVYKTTPDGRERVVYSLPAMCDRIRIDAERDINPVWGLVGNQEDGSLRQVNGEPAFRGDGFLYG